MNTEIGEILFQVEDWAAINNPSAGGQKNQVVHEVEYLLARLMQRGGDIDPEVTQTMQCMYDRHGGRGV